jgi:hypothetical protein
METKKVSELQRNDIININPLNPGTNPAYSYIVASATPTKDNSYIVVKLLTHEGAKVVESWEPDSEIHLGEW